MNGMTIGEMLRACRGEWQGSEETLKKTPFSVVTDSRQAGEGSLFLALRGEKTDGHKYIPDVLQKGALAVLCEERGASGEPRLVVPDTLEAMQRIAAASRARWNIPFIGITGSVGKTTAKEMLAAALSGKYAVFKTPGSMNGQIGIPVSLLGLRGEYDVAVIEMGVSLFGEMTRLTNMVHPDMAVFMNIGDAHLEALGDRPGILRAKSEMLLGMKDDAVAFANGDDALLSHADFRRKTVLFGLGEKCAVRAADIRQNGESLSCRIIAGERDFPVTVPAYGNYMIYSVLAAAAVSLELGLSDAEIARGLALYQTVGRRSRVERTAYCTLVDDCYNANPTSDCAAIDSLASLGGRRVCVLGDMLEMGENAPALHRTVGEYAVTHGVALVITQGDLAGYIAEGAGEKGMRFPDRAALLHALPELIRPGDTVLVKASHGAHFEEVSEAIKCL